jgi:TetR/AcrR family tetracycline transcriptional repressor
MARRQASISPRPRGLTLDLIVSETLALIDEQGVGAASMRAVAARVGVEAQSLYAHVESRGRLLDAVVDHIVDELSDDPEVSLWPSDGWRQYLTRLAHGVRRYARAHPHAFPLVATRPAAAPWINPPLRSLRWVEAFLSALRAQGFPPDQTLFAYRSFNSYLLGFLLLETGAMSLSDPASGDGSFASGRGSSDEEGQPAAAVPGGLTPTRTRAERQAVGAADDRDALINPLHAIELRDYPTIRTLAKGLVEDYYATEFASGLDAALDRIDRYRRPSRPTRGKKSAQAD